MGGYLDWGSLEGVMVMIVHVFLPVSDFLWENLPQDMILCVQYSEICRQEFVEDVSNHSVHFE